MIFRDRYVRQSSLYATLSLVGPPLLVLLAMSLDHRIMYNRWDNFEYFSVATTAAHDHWLRGEVPHWNPHQHMGEPTIGTIQPAPFYPVYTFIWLCMRLFGMPVEQFSLFANLVHFGIAGLGWYYLLRLLDFRPAIALLGSAGGATSGFSLILSQDWIFIAATFAWIPWILLGIVGSLRERAEVRYRIALGVGLTSSLLIGYPQLGVYSWLFGAWFAGVWAFLVAGTLRRLAGLGFIALSAGLMAAPAWLPGLYFFMDSARTNSWNIEYYQERSVPPGLALLDWILPSFPYPNFHGSFNSAYGYEGAWLVPALFGAWLVWRRRRTSGQDAPARLEKNLRLQMRAALLCGVLPYLLALGKYAKLTTILYGIPVWSSFRNPYKFLPFFLASFLIAAACGLEICWRHSDELVNYRRWFVVSAGIIFVSWVLAEWLVRRYIAGRFPNARLPDLPVSAGCTILSVVILVLCLRNSRWLTGLIPLQIVLLVSLCNQANLKTYQPGSMRVSARQLGISTDFRVLPLSNFRTSGVFQTPHMGEYALFHTATLNGYYSLTGCAAPSMLPKWFVRWLPSNEYGLLASGNDERVGTNLLRSYNARYYVVAKKDSTNLKIVQSVPGMRLLSEQTETLVYEDAQALPRIWFASSVQSYSEIDMERALVRNQESATAAFIEGKLPDSFLEPGRLVESSWNENQVRVVFEARKPALLVVAATWYPGWKGLLDGRPVAVQRVNGTLLGIAVPAGARELILEYRTSGLSAGLGLAVVGLIVLLHTCRLRTRSSTHPHDKPAAALA